MPSPLSLSSLHFPCPMEKDEQIQKKWCSQSKLWCALDKTGLLWREAVLHEPDRNSISSRRCLWKCYISVASPGQVIQRRYTRSQSWLKFHSCVTSLLLLSQRETWCCVYISMCVCLILSWDVYFFSCAYFPTQPSFCGSICCRVSEQYWFIISDSCDTHPHYSPLRTCFQSLLDVEPQKISTHAKWFLVLILMANAISLLIYFSWK